MPAISVHIVTYNSAATLETCLEGVRNQAFADYETIVFDNHSTDHTREIVRDAGVPLVESSANIGYAGAHNRLIDQTESTYILTLNPDVLLLPEFLGSMQRALAGDAAIGSAAGKLLRVDRLGDTPTVIDSAGLAMRRSRRQRLLGELTPVVQYPASPRPIFGPDGAAAFYRRAMLDDIRLLDEVFDSDFFMHKEDIDVCWRARLRGWESVYIPDAVAHHIRSFRPGRRERVSADMRLLGVRNRYLLMIKNEISAHFWRDFPAIAAYDLGIFAYMLLRERQSLAALSSTWALRKRMFEKRRIVQSQRRVGWRDMARWFEA